MSQPARNGNYGVELEQALRSYETALADTAPGRHASPDTVDENVHKLRTQVVRLAEHLPSICWPRPACEYCQGQREVQALQARPSSGSDTPSFANSPRLCRPCWGTGLTLDSAVGD